MYTVVSLDRGIQVYMTYASLVGTIHLRCEMLHKSLQLHPLHSYQWHLHTYLCR